MLTTRLTPSYATVPERASHAVFPSDEVAVTVIAHRPAVRSSGGTETVPSSATATVGPAAAVGLGPALASGAAPDGAGMGPEPAPSGPRNCVVMDTLAAFVVVP